MTVCLCTGRREGQVHRKSKIYCCQRGISLLKVKKQQNIFHHLITEAEREKKNEPIERTFCQSQNLWGKYYAPLLQ